MIQKIKSFKEGDKFKVGGQFANIYKGKTFEVYKLSTNYLMAKAFDHRGVSDGQEYAFDQVNFDAYGDAVKRIGGQSDKRKIVGRVGSQT